MPLNQYIEQDLRRRILTGKSVPEPLTLSAISHDYGVSSMPVRGAVNRLIEDGILIKDPTGRLSINPETPPAAGDSEVRNQENLEPDSFPGIRNEVIWRSLRGESRYLRVSELAERYDIGRTKAQNLLQRLAVEGLVEHHPRRGWRIRPFHAADLESFIEARVALELTSFDLAREKFDRSHIDLLYSKNSPEGDCERLDDSLHRYWIDLAQNRYITDFIERSGRFYDTLYHSANIDDQLTGQLASQHREILGAIRRGHWNVAKTAISEDLLVAQTDPQRQCDPDGRKRSTESNYGPPISTMNLFASMGTQLIAALILAQCLFAEEKLDAGLDRGDEPKAIFVRMEEQVFKRAGDFENFTSTFRDAERSRLSRQIVEKLKRNSDQSWSSIAGAIKRLTEEGQVKGLKRYWVVNGFACLATPEACAELAKEKEVSFVYNLKWVQLHDVGIEASPIGNDVLPTYRRILADWKPDGDEPFSTEGLKIGWNLEDIGARTVWEEERTAGRGVVIALYDGGVLPYPGLARALWKNPGEALDGNDTDGNGYVDDIFGYHFETRSGDVITRRGDNTHGTICGSIMSGRPTEDDPRVTGVAPESRVMLVRGKAGQLELYQYLIENGADVLSRSYNIGNIGQLRGLYRTAHEHMTAAGVLTVGGAGNFRQRLPKGRQISVLKDIPCVLCVAGVYQDRKQAPFSSEGPVYWSGIRFYNDYPKANPLMKPDVTAFPGQVSSLGVQVFRAMPIGQFLLWTARRRRRRADVFRQSGIARLEDKRTDRENRTGSRRTRKRLEIRRGFDQCRRRGPRRQGRTMSGFLIADQAQNLSHSHGYPGLSNQHLFRENGAVHSGRSAFLTCYPSTH